MMILIHCLLGILFLGTILVYKEKLRDKNYWKLLWNNYSFLWIALGIMWIATFFSSFNAIVPSLSYYGLFKLTEGIILVWIILTMTFKYLYLNFALIAAATVQTALALSQWFLQKNVIQTKWLGLGELSANMKAAAVIEYLKYTENSAVVGEFWHRWLRSYGAFPHPNILGGFLLIVVLIALGVYLHKSYGWTKLFSSLLASFIFTGLLLTFSRSAWLAFSLSFILMVILIFLYKTKTKVEAEKKSDNVFAILKYVFIIFGIVIAFVAVYPDHFYTRTHMGTRLEEMSYKDRTWQYKTAINIIPKNVFFGGGMYNYALYLPHNIIDFDLQQPGGMVNVQYSALVENHNDKREAIAYQPVHNLFLLVWAEIGVFACLALLGLLAWIFGALLYSYRFLSKDMILLGYSLAFLALGLTAMFDHYWWTNWSSMALFWLIIALTIKRYYFCKKREMKNK